MSKPKTKKQLDKIKRKLEREINMLMQDFGHQGITLIRKDEYLPLQNNQWSYNYSISFYADSNIIRHMRPKGLSNVEVNASVRLIANIEEWEVTQENVPSKITDPFALLNFHTTLRAKSKSEIFHTTVFHVDRHDETKLSNEIHPLYHLQYRQNAEEISDFAYGHTLELDIPRFVHLPMELILGLDFLLATFSPEKRKVLCGNSTYINICKQYQKNIWYPYLKSLISNWEHNPSSVWKADSNHPLFKFK